MSISGEQNMEVLAILETKGNLALFSSHACPTIEGKRDWNCDI